MQSVIALTNLAVPGCIFATSDDLVLTNVPLGGCVSDLEDAPVVDMHGAIALPAFVDMLDVLRDATRVARLGHTGTDWPKSVSLTPAQACGFDLPDLLGGASNMVIFNARNWSELFARPQSDRIVISRGRAITRRTPQVHGLDDLMGRQ